MCTKELDTTTGEERLSPSGAVGLYLLTLVQGHTQFIQGELLLAGLLGSWPIRSRLLLRSLVLDTVAGVGAHSWIGAHSRTPHGSPRPRGRGGQVEEV